MNKQMNKELEKADQQFQKFDENVKSMTMDHMNKTPVTETEPQAKISNREMHADTSLYLKPTRNISSKEPFNEKYRIAFEKAMEYIPFVAENNEVRGETLHLWTKPFPGHPAEEWKVPVNKTVRGPRHLAARISKCHYHRLKTEDNVVGDIGAGITQYGCLVVDETIHRLNARPASTPFLAMGS